MKKKPVSLSVFDRFFPPLQEKRKFIFIPFAIFFTLSSICLYFYGKGIFFYQENSSLFIYSIPYLNTFVSMPGGLLVYAGNFLSQFYFSPLAGSLIISSLLTVLCIVFGELIKLFSPYGSFSLLFTFLPSAALLLIQTRYDFYPHHLLGFLLALIWFLASIRPAKAGFRIILTGLFPFFYYLTGSFTIVYIGLYLVYSFTLGKGKIRFIRPAVLILYAALTFFVFRSVLFLQTAGHLLAFPLFINETSRLTLFLKLTSGFIIISPLILKSTGLIPLKEKTGRLIPFSATALLFILTLFLLIKNYDREKASVMEVEKMVYMRDWDSIIRHQERFSTENIVVEYYYNLALSEKGQLCSRMFFGPQNYGPMSLTLPRDNEQDFRALYFYYCIGLVSEAHHLAYELMVKHGYRPENIKMLIRTELINGNYKIAERYINVLKNTLHYKRWAEKHEKLLFNPGLIAADPELGEKLRLLPKNDFFIDTDDSRNIVLMLNADPGNKKAYEYKLARLLLDKDIKEIGNEIGNLKDLGYALIPRHLEEATVALVNVTGKFPPMGGLLISGDTDSRFINYFSVINSFKGKKASIEKGINNATKNTFWYYLQFTTVKSSYTRIRQEDNSIY